MAKVKYYAKGEFLYRNSFFYAVPIPNGTLTFDELLDESNADGVRLNHQSPRLGVTEFAKAVKRNVLKGLPGLSDNFRPSIPTFS